MNADLGALFRGLPDDRPAAALGLHGQGQSGFRLSERKEMFEAGDAYYVPPGHVPVHTRGPRSWSSVRPTCWRRQ